LASTGAAPARVSEQSQTAIVAAKASFLTRISTGPACFYWIAALTLLNSIVVISGRSLHFAIGLGSTAGIDVKAKELGTIGAVLDLLISGTIAGIFALLGNLAGKRIRWAFLAGMVLYGIDGLICLAANDILGASLHAYTIFAISRGMTTPKPVPIAV
jgi:hypothetical protein